MDVDCRLAQPADKPGDSASAPAASLPKPRASSPPGILSCDEYEVRYAQRGEMRRSGPDIPHLMVQVKPGPAWSRCSSYSARWLAAPLTQGQSGRPKELIYLRELRSGSGVVRI